MRGGWPGMRIITSQGMTNAWSRHDMCLCGQVCLSMTGDPWVWRRGAERRADRDPQSRQAGPPMPWGTFIFYLRWYFFLSQFLDCDHGECQFYGMQGFSSPLFLFSAAAVCIGIGLSETDPALLSLLLNDFLSASSKEPPPPRHLFALPPKGKIDTYWLNLIFINNRTSKKRSDIFLTFR